MQYKNARSSIIVASIDHTSYEWKLQGLPSQMLQAFYSYVQTPNDQTPNSYVWWKIKERSKMARKCIMEMNTFVQFRKFHHCIYKESSLSGWLLGIQTAEISAVPAAPRPIVLPSENVRKRSQ